MESEKWTFVITILVFLSFSTGVFSRSSSYTRRARSDCYLPTGSQYDRSMYLRIHGWDMTPLPPGERISKGYRILVVCRKDIQHDAVMHSSTSRCIYGKWRPSLPDCIALERCGNAPLVPNSQPSEIWQSSKTYPHDYVVTYTCNPDLFLTGDDTIQCKNGTWTDVAFTCTYPANPDKCRQKEVSNGHVTEVTATTYKVTCHRGFDLDTEGNVFTCNSGEWLGKEPRCKPLVCPSLSHVKYDIVYSPLQNTKLPVYGSTIQVWCPAGQSPYRDVNTATCVDGIWEPFRPFCRRYCTIQQQYRLYSRFTHLKSAMTVRDKVGHGQKVVQRCNGDATKHRCFHGRWRPAFKRCQPVDTAIPAPDYRNDLFNEIVDDLNLRCKILPGNSFEFLSEDETILYDDNDTIKHGITIKQVCKGDEKLVDKHHHVKCNNGTWSPDLKACPNEDCDVYFDSGEIRSGQMNSPDNIDDSFTNSICTYNFHMEASEKVTVTFQEFNIIAGEPDNSCKDSYLEYKTKEASGNIVKLCGKSLPSVIEESGPGLVITLNTYNADVVSFIATFEFMTVDVSCQPPNSLQFEYEPGKDSYRVNDTIEIWCQDETRYLIGSEIWSCMENGQWNDTSECIPYEQCELQELNGVKYDIDNEIEMVSGTLKHSHTAVVYKTCDGTGNLDNLGSYETVECDNGTLSKDIVSCPEEPEEENVSTCLPPAVTGITFSPIKNLYLTDDTVSITGCSDSLLIPVGVSELVCDKTGSWAGSVQCLTHCENGITFFSVTEYSFFNRRSDIIYKQLNDVDTLTECQERCFGYEDFGCRSIEYRGDKSACVLTNMAPNDEQFTAINSATRSSVIYELACDNRCSIPSVIPEGVVYTDSSHQSYVPDQQVASGTVVNVVCRKTFTSRQITCMGGQWDEIMFEDFC